MAIQPPYSAGSSSSASATTTPGNPNYRGMVPVGDHVNSPGESPGSPLSPATSQTTILKHMLASAVRSVSFVYGNFIGPEANNANDITIGASLKTASGATIRLTFGGDRQKTLKPGESVQTDPVSINASSGSYVLSYNYVSVASGSWPGVVKADRVFATETVVNSVDGTDFSMSQGTINAGFGALGWGPMMVLGTTPTARPIIGGFGDSILFGTGDTTLIGFFERALSGAYPFVKSGHPGRQLSTNASLFLIHKRMKNLAGCTHILNQFGTNDISGGATAAAVAANLLLMWQTIVDSGAKAYNTTYLPSPTSSDSWATLGNQTLPAYETVRTTLNDWIRNGAKVTGGVAVFDGTGTASTLLSGYVETADAVESSRNSGKWKVPSYTADGTHPSATGATAIATVVSTWAATLTLT